MGRTTAPEPYLQELANGVYAYVQPDGGWCLSNSGILAGGLLVDTAATQRRARALRAAVTSVTTAPPKILVNTHHHGDHTYGNGLFPEAVIVGHDECPAAMREQGLVLTQLWTDVEWGDLEIVPPSLTFPDRLSVRSGDVPVELIHVGPAHTTNDVVAWLPEQRILFTGDIVITTATPFVLMGSVAGSLAALDLLGTLQPEIVVPGHGPVGGPELFDRTEGYLRRVQELARYGVAEGLSPLTLAAETDLGEYGEWLDSERIVGNLHRAYAEEQGEPRGAKLDDLAIIMEMVTYNGGKIPTCLA